MEAVLASVQSYGLDLSDGDLAGDHALAAMGQEIRRRGASPGGARAPLGLLVTHQSLELR